MPKIITFLLIIISLGNGQDKAVNPHGDKINFACETCHAEADWNKVPGWKFNHDQTGYPLVGDHQTLKCIACHEDLHFNRVGIACIDCHSDIHKGELGIRCENCHNSQTWENRQQVFEVHNETNFPLIGVHANLDCESCHINQQQKEFVNLSIECRSCHLTNYMQTLNPAHQKAGFDLDCQNCHLPNVSSWQRDIYEHPASFPLSEGHSGLECLDCHASNFTSTSTDCYSCHRKDYELVSEPNHLTFGFPTVCEQCHNGISWERSTFDHFLETGFAIEGAHQSNLCTDCHLNNQLTGIPRECIGCHLSEFNSAKNPDHIANSLSTQCLDCHNQNAWDPALFNHDITDFPLTGKHTTVECIDCHANSYANTPSDCWSCHDTDFNSALDPNHITNNFDHDCTQCHTTSAWEPANFDHAVSQFPLTGAHISVACTDCHTSGYQVTLPTDCWSCHDNDFIAVQDPNHVTNNFDHDCIQCHNANAWMPADFSHENTQFPLTGAHIVTNCTDCHSSGYNNTPIECFACHDNDFNSTSDPNHTSAHFPATCEDCHSTAAWTPANWDHDAQYFPIYSGKHLEAWSVCADCHVSANDYKQFECILCHEHSNERDLADKHKDEQGYEFNSAACYDCHPDGRK